MVVNVEPGDQRKNRYGLAVDCGSTTIVMQLIDMNSGMMIDQVKAVNGQTEYGTDVLSRITDSLEDPARMDDLQRATAKTFDSLLAELTENAGIGEAKQNLELAWKVMSHDDVVDGYFAKYFERIGDHCTNIAEWVEFSVTGEH